MWRKTRLAQVQLILVSTAFSAGCGSDAVTAPGSEDLQLEAVSATELQGTVGEAVDAVPRVIVKNKMGVPVPGIAVSFSVLGGTFWTTPETYINFAHSGSVTHTTAVTDAQGIASPGEWTLGPLAGLQGLHADFVGEAGWRLPLILFYAQAAPAAPAELSLVHGDQQAGLPGWFFLSTVRITDRFGNPVSAIPVRFAVNDGGGSLAQGGGVWSATTELQTDTYGNASAAWKLGPSPGLNTLVASASDLDAVTFTAEAIDTGPLTWYDIESMDGTAPFARSSVGLGEKGYFALVTDGGIAFPNDLDERTLGAFSISGTEIVLTHHNGATEEGTLDNERLSLRRGDYLKAYVGLHGSEVWTYRKRTEE